MNCLLVDKLFALCSDNGAQKLEVFKRVIKRFQKIHDFQKPRKLTLVGLGSIEDLKFGVVTTNPSLHAYKAKLETAQTEENNNDQAARQIKKRRNTTCYGELIIVENKDGRE